MILCLTPSGHLMMNSLGGSAFDAAAFHGEYLWSLFDFICSGLLGSASRFKIMSQLSMK